MERWQTFDRAGEQKNAVGDYSGYRAAQGDGQNGDGLERDAQMESLCRSRWRELGIDFDLGHRLGRNILLF